MYAIARRGEILDLTQHQREIILAVLHFTHAPYDPADWEREYYEVMESIGAGLKGSARGRRIIEQAGVQKLTERIHVLFAESSPPLLRKPRGTDIEWDRCFDRFRGSWEALSAEDVEDSYLCVMYFNDEEFLYYLPAYLRSILSYPAGLADAWLVFNIVNRRDLLLSELTAQKRQLVYDVLTLTHSHYDPEDCLDAYHEAREILQS